MSIDYRPKPADVSDPGPIANAEAHLKSIGNASCTIAARAAVERLIEHARLLEHALTPEPPSMKAWHDVYAMKGPK